MNTLNRNLITVNGIVQVDPNREGVKKVHENLVIVKVSDDLSKYYRHFINAKYGLMLDPPCFGSHITLTNKRQPLNTDNAQVSQYLQSIDKMSVKIQYDPKDLYRAWHFFCISVQSDAIKDICKTLGLHTYPKLHLTIGRLPEKVLIPSSKSLSIKLL